MRTNIATAVALASLNLGCAVTSPEGSSSDAGAPVRFSALELVAGQPNGIGSQDGIGSSARFWQPWGAASDGAGTLYVSDDLDRTIRQIVLATAAVTTVAGSPGRAGQVDGQGASAVFGSPEGLATDGAGNLYVADAEGETIRRVVVATGTVSTLAGTPQVVGSSDGIGSAASFNRPSQLALDGLGNLYIADSNNQTIRRLALATGQVATVAGSPGVVGSADGVGSAAQFNYPAGLAFDAAGNLYVADSQNDTIRKLVPATGEVTTVAGTAGAMGLISGPAAVARFYSPGCLVADSTGNLYIGDSGNGVIRTLDLSTGEVSTLGSPGTMPALNLIQGMALDARGNIEVSDLEAGTVVQVSHADGSVTPLAGQQVTEAFVNGTGASSTFGAPNGLAFDGIGDLFVADWGNSMIREVSAGTDDVSTLACLPDSAFAPGGVVFGSVGAPMGVALGGDGKAYVADEGNSTIEAILLTTGEVSTLAGQPGTPGFVDGTGAAARFDGPAAIAADGQGVLYVADNCAIRKVEVSTGQVTTLAGTSGQPGSVDGPGSAASFWNPGGIALGGDGSLYIADTDNGTIRRLDLTTLVVSTVAGWPGLVGNADAVGVAATFSQPQGIAADGAGHLFVADTGNATIREVEVGSRQVTTVVGVSGQSGIAVGPIAQARLTGPTGLAVSSSGDLYIADFFGDVILAARATR